MISTRGASLLVKLSDGMKAGLAQLAVATSDYLSLYHENREILEAQKRAAASMDFDAMEEAAARVPTEHVSQAIHLSINISHLALNVVLLACFTLEAYANAYADFSISQALGSPSNRGRHVKSPRTRIMAYLRKPLSEKWRELPTLASGEEFELDSEPFVSFRTLVTFRNDCVHAKVKPFKRIPSHHQNIGRLPDPTLEMLTLGHAIFASDTYWQMVNGLYERTGASRKEFERHYVLAPWPDDATASEWAALAAAYDTAHAL